MVCGGGASDDDDDNNKTYRENNITRRIKRILEKDMRKLTEL